MQGKESGHSFLLLLTYFSKELSYDIFGYMKNEKTGKSRTLHKKETWKYQQKGQTFLYFKEKKS
jgi:hypothetical protein